MVQTGETEGQIVEFYEAVQRRLVGSLFAVPDVLSQVLEAIRTDDVEEPQLNLIFNAMALLAREDVPVSVIAVAEKLDEQGMLEKSGGIGSLFALSSDGKKYACEATPAVYARIVKELSAKTKIAVSLDEAKSQFKPDSGVKASDAVSTLQSVLNERLLSLSDSSTVSRFPQVFDAYPDILRDRRDSSNEDMVGIPSLLPTLDSITHGWQPGQMITVGARTGIGKSVFAVNCAVAAAQANATVMLFSLEMSQDQITDRIVSSTNGIPLSTLKTGELSAEQMNMLDNDEIARMRIIVDTEPKLTVDMIRARALKQAQSPQGLDFVVVDYLQLITPVGRFSSRQEAVADISRNMKLLAKQLEVPVMVLVQLNRNAGKDEENPLPELEHIRESGAIGQDSDVVLLLHRDKPLDSVVPHTLVIVAKNRDGEASRIIRCHSDLECSVFHEVRKVADVEDDWSELE